MIFVPGATAHHQPHSNEQLGKLSENDGDYAEFFQNLGFVSRLFTCLFGFVY